MAKVFLDAGHGGKDPGAIGNNLQEKDINLAVTLKVGEILIRHEVEVMFSRATDVHLELHERTQKANLTNSDILISIHCNSAENRTARGVETFHYSGSERGAALARCIQDELIATKLYSVNRGVKTANFHMIRASNMPGVLTELAFISNSDDAKILRDKQEQLALAIAKGILTYLGIKYIDPKKEDSNKVKVNIKGKDYLLDGFLKNGTNYVPIRAVAEALGYKVDWDNATKTVIIKLEGK